MSVSCGFASNNKAKLNFNFQTFITTGIRRKK